MGFWMGHQRRDGMSLLSKALSYTKPGRIKYKPLRLNKAMCMKRLIEKMSVQPSQLATSQFQAEFSTVCQP
jgi:hypothetical protein